MRFEFALQEALEVLAAFPDDLRGLVAFVFDHDRPAIVDGQIDDRAEVDVPLARDGVALIESHIFLGVNHPGAVGVAMQPVGRVMPAPMEVIGIELKSDQIGIGLGHQDLHPAPFRVVFEMSEFEGVIVVEKARSGLVSVFRESHQASGGFLEGGGGAPQFRRQGGHDEVGVAECLLKAEQGLEFRLQPSERKVGRNDLETVAIEQFAPGIRAPAIVAGGLDGAKSEGGNGGEGGLGILGKFVAQTVQLQAERGYVHIDHARST